REGGDAALLFRPPYGKKLTGLPIALARTGHRTIMWDIEDPETSDPKAFSDQVLEQVRPGSIILTHAMYRRRDTARRALPLILTGLKDRGYRAVTMSELLRLEQPGTN
ncbi:MAG: polysaccharide deacetylase, partial [Sphingomonas sp.]